MGQASSDQQVAILTWLQVEPDRLDDFDAVMRVFTADVRTYEPACRDYRVVYQVGDRTRVLVMARYASMEAYYAHVTAPHTISITSILDPMLIGAPVISVYLDGGSD